MKANSDAQSADTLPTGFWWISAIILIMIALVCMRCILMPPVLASKSAAALNDAAYNHQKATSLPPPVSSSIASKSADQQHTQSNENSPSPGSPAPSQLSNHVAQQNSPIAAKNASVTPEALRIGPTPSTTNEAANSTPSKDELASGRAIPSKPRLPARESVSTLLSKIEDRKKNPPNQYKSLRLEDKNLSRSEKMQARTSYTDENFQSLCADCHLLHDSQDWQADLGPDLCNKVDCSDFTRLSFYINRFMPPENPTLCEGACASELALYIFYQGNAVLAAMHQMAPSILMHAGIQITDTESGTVLLNRPPLTNSP